MAGLVLDVGRALELVGGRVDPAGDLVGGESFGTHAVESTGDGRGLIRGLHNKRASLGALDLRAMTRARDLTENLSRGEVHRSAGGREGRFGRRWTLGGVPPLRMHSPSPSFVSYHRPGLMSDSFIPGCCLDEGGLSNGARESFGAERSEVAAAAPSFPRLTVEAQVP